MTVSVLRKEAGDFTTIFVSFISKLYWFLNLALLCTLSNWNLVGLKIISLTLNHFLATSQSSSSAFESVTTYLIVA